MTLLALDGRWRRMMDPTYACPCCGQGWGGVFDIGFDAPDVWPHITPREANRPDVEISQNDSSGDPEHGLKHGPEHGPDRLTADLCRLGPDRFLRALLTLPIRGSTEQVHIGLWAQVAPDTLYAYIDHATQGATFASAPGTLATALPFGIAAQTPCTLTAGADGQCPQITALGPSDARARTPRSSSLPDLSFDDLLDLYAACGQDLRPHLAG
ncbi:MAG: DUF2199 domain-containing protein [Paracoccaceae bacterium]